MNQSTPNEQPKGQLKALESEYLSVSAGKIEGKANAVLSFRLKPKQNKHETTFALSAEQMVRLHQDLGQLIKKHEEFQSISDGTVDFVEWMQGGAYKPKRQRKPKAKDSDKPKS